MDRSVAPTEAQPRTLGTRLNTATKHLAGPLAVVDLDAFDANARDLVSRAGGTPVRLATKSVRVPDLISRALAQPGWAGVMAFSLREALWLVEQGHRDILLGYPTVDRPALAEFLTNTQALRSITLMMDDAAQARVVHEVANDAGVQLASTAAATAAPVPALGGGTDPAFGIGLMSGAVVQVCIDVDSSWRPGFGPLRAHLGARRSPVHTPAEAVAAALAVEAVGGFRVRGLMFYEAQVAGLPDTSWAVRLVKRASNADLARRRNAVATAVGFAVGRQIDLVNSGGTGSLETSSADSTVTEVTAGSGLLLPTLFDGYRNVRPRPAAFFGLDVVRRPAPGVATAFAGGYVASGPAGVSRLPSIVEPVGAKLTSSEAAGEVQTPIRLPSDAQLAVGDRVWLRHAKAGELMERFTHVHLVRGSEIVETVPTYRGAGKSFG